MSVNNLSKIIINNEVYYLLDEIRNNLLINIKPCITTRKLINELKLNNTDYIYAYNKSNTWIISSNSYSRSKILIKENSLNNIEMGNKESNKIENNNNIENTITEKNTEIECILLNAPKLIIDDKEINIEVRYLGYISQDTVLFRVKDVAEEFNVPKLKDIIIQKNSSFTIDEDYKYVKVSGCRGKPYIYLTFLGLLRFSFVNRSSITSKKITKWANDILFIHQYGSHIKVNELSAKVTANYHTIVCNIFSKFDFPCIYLLGIGTYQNYSNVYKFGRTDNFNRRYKEHGKTYNVVPTICILQHIDPDYLAKAENDIKTYMISINSLITVDNHDELVTLTDKQMKMVTNVYKDMSHKYSTKTDILQEQIKLLTHQNDIIIRDTELKIVKEQHINELLKKDIQLLTLENEYLKKIINK